MEEQQQIEMSKEKEKTEFDPTQLPHVKNWDGALLYQHQGFWLGSLTVQGFFPFQKHFRAQDSDVIVATFPKSGTTWLKALTFSILNRTHFSPSIHNKTHPLLSSNSHDLVPFLEIVYRNKPSPDPLLHLPPHPTKQRVLSTHLPYSLLAPSIEDDHLRNNIRIVYMCRNPLDQFISSYLFFHKVMLQTLPQPEPRRHNAADDLELLNIAFDLFCRGIQRAGPSLDHHLEYWKMSLERPDKVLFLKFEDLKEDSVGVTKTLAEFLGCPISQEEEREGVIEDMIRLCSLETMKDLEVNKTCKQEVFGFDNSCYFRKGEVGDWANYLTPSMVERVNKIVEEKLAASGLTFHFFNKVNI